MKKRDLIRNKIMGALKMYDKEKGFGFIFEHDTINNGPSSIYSPHQYFFHISEFIGDKSKLPNESYRILSCERVLFNIIRGKNGKLQAVNVELYDWKDHLVELQATRKEEALEAKRAIQRQKKEEDMLLRETADYNMFNITQEMNSGRFWHNSKKKNTSRKKNLHAPQIFVEARTAMEANEIAAEVCEIPITGHIGFGGARVSCGWNTAYPWYENWLDEDQSIEEAAKDYTEMRKNFMYGYRQALIIMKDGTIKEYKSDTTICSSYYNCYSASSSTVGLDEWTIIKQ